MGIKTKDFHIKLGGTIIIELPFNNKPVYCETMSKRVTIMIDDDLDKKLRLRQAKLISQEQTSYSYSRVLNDTIRKVLK